jgi:peptidoglycan/LPS O-acetylase OafA/YrhL
MNRLPNLDYLRGLAATGIMCYHFGLWYFGAFHASDFLGRVGVYGVVLFYVLSGLTLYLVYNKRMQPTAKEVRHFALRRVFRILPLLWLVNLLSIWVGEKSVELSKLLLNFTGLFGFFSWDSYIATGAWSIGNELVFYVFFPIFIGLLHLRKWAFYALSLAVFGLFLYFTFFVMQPAIPVAKQWFQYTNPLNQLCYFLAGIWIGFLFENKVLKVQQALLLVLSGLLLLIFIPGYGDYIVLVSGANRLAFAAAVIVLCIGVYKWPLALDRYTHRVLTFLGEVSYAVYLLHPIVYTALGRMQREWFWFPEYLRFVLAFPLTLGISYLVYRFYEQYFIRKAKALTP